MTTENSELGRQRMIDSVCLGSLAGVAMFGEVQRPPFAPFNLTYVLFFVVLLRVLIRPLKLEWRASDTAATCLLVSALAGSLIAYVFQEFPFFAFPRPDAGSLSFLAMVISYALSRMMLHRPSHIRLCIAVITAWFNAAAIVGLALYYGSSGERLAFLAEGELSIANTSSFTASRLTGMFGNPNMFATLPVLLLPLAIANMLWARSVWHMGTACMSAFLCTATILMAYSRSAWIASSVSTAMVVAIAVRRSKGGSRLRATLVGGILASSAMVGAAFVVSDEQALVDRMASLGERASLGQRDAIWLHSLELMLTHPLGVGLGNSKLVSEVVDSAYSVAKGRSAHNSMIAIGVECGLIGMFALAALVGAGLCAYRRVTVDASPQLQSMAAGLSASMLGFMIHSSFHAVHSHVVFWVIVACATGLTGARRV